MSTASFAHLVSLADTAVPHVRRLAEDTEHPQLRALAGDAVAALNAAVAEITTAVDLLLAPFPRCPVSGMVEWAIRGGRVVAASEAVAWSNELDAWASAVERIN